MNQDPSWFKITFFKLCLTSNPQIRAPPDATSFAEGQPCGDGSCFGIVEAHHEVVLGTGSCARTSVACRARALVRISDGPGASTTCVSMRTPAN